MTTPSEIAAAKNALIQSTAGAIPFMNEKGTYESLQKTSGQFLRMAILMCS